MIGQKQRLVIIGNGMVGMRLVEDVLAHQGGDLFDIIVFGDEPYGNYNRILLSNVLAGVHDATDIFLNPLAWYRENGITLHSGQRVTHIDRQKKLVYTTEDIVQPYDRLVIATGSTPYIPTIENLHNGAGQLKEGAFIFRSLDDCEKIIQYTVRASRAAVLGGGLLGLEAARGLLNRGLEAHVIQLSNRPMNVQLDAPAGDVLKATLQRMGLHMHTGKTTTAVFGEQDVRGLKFHDGMTLDCDMLIISAGIRPNVELAKRAGIEVERGIIVNDDLTCRNDS